MSGQVFYDSGKFTFEMVDDGNGGSYLTPLHFRELGEKEGHLYGGDTSWSDVLINRVPLEKTLEEKTLNMEDEIVHYSESSDSDNSQIIINKRDVNGQTFDDEEVSKHEKKWMNRIEKIQLNPVSLPEAKKKGKSQGKYPVKPVRTTKEIRGERSKHSSETLHEMIDVREDREIKEFIYNITSPSGEKKIFCPPEHWVTPVIQWDKIWCAIDEIKMGSKRDYHYTKPGEINIDGKVGPIIYFYDKNSCDLNFDFRYERDVMTCSVPVY